MYLLKSLRTTSAPPSTLVDTVAREEKHPVPKETGEGKVLAGKHCKTQEGATGREIYVFLAGTRFHIPQFFFCAVSTKYLMIVFIFYRTGLVVSLSSWPRRNRSVALFDSVACNKVWSLCATLWGFPSRVVFLLKSVPFIKLMQYLGSMQSARLPTANEGECNLLRLLYVILVQFWYLSEHPTLI